MQRVFGVARICAKSNGVLSVVPSETPYFEPNRIQFRSFDCEGKALEHLDFRIGAVTVGGSPQLAINNLTPDEESRSGSISSKDLNKVNWAVFSTEGLARELQIAIYNPHEVDLLIYACVEGEPIEGLGCYVDSESSSWSEEERETLSEEEKRKRLIEENKKRMAKYEEREREKYEKRAKEQSVKIGKWKSAEGGLQHVGSKVAELQPRERRLLQIIPTASPYFEPWGARYHCSRASDGADVPLIVVDAICGRKALIGGLLSSFEELLQGAGQGWIEDGPYEAMSRLREYIGMMEHDGILGIHKAKMRKIRSAPVPEIDGIPSILLEDPKFNDWHEILDFPVFSTKGLAKPFFVLLYNPWPFSVRASVTVCGKAVSSLAEGRLKVVG